MKFTYKGEKACFAQYQSSRPEFVVITGGPGAGKTAFIEFARKRFCEHVALLPEAASILFGGGFFRFDSVFAKKVAQTLIFEIQRGSEAIIIDENRAPFVLCDRGSLDGLAYWPGSQNEFCATLNTTMSDELVRYSAVIHLRSPSLVQGYDFSNPVRVESADEAKRIDDKIHEIWKRHPRHFEVPSGSDFLEKVQRAAALVESLMPGSCRMRLIGERA